MDRKMWSTTQNTKRASVVQDPRLTLPSRKCVILGWVQATCLEGSGVGVSEWEAIQEWMWVSVTRVRSRSWSELEVD